MGRRIFFLFLLLIFVIPGISSAGDPPHNEASGVSCSNCHGQTLLDNQSPFYTENKSDLAYNSVCTGVCHNQNPVGYETGYEYHGEASSPRVLSHTPGGTVIKCIVCHHNHDQDQIYAGKNNKNQFFLATGTLATDVTSPISYNSGTDRTTLTYATLAATDTDPNNRWNDLTLLAKKTGDGRGAMLVPNHTYRRRWPVYIVKSIDTDARTITVKGNVASASNLGIFYGQSIRRSVNFEPVAGMPKTVSFFDRQGNNGLTNSNATGICQVCHESGTVNYWTNDGGGQTHNPGNECMLCHLHSTGFTHGGATGGDCDTCHDTQDEHDKRVASAGCANCHTVGTQAEIDVEHDPSGQCAPCHGYGGDVLNTAVVATAIQDGKDGIDQNCEACHTGPGSPAHHQTAMASNVDCTVRCHADVNHTAMVAAESGCVSCHTATAGTTSSVPLSLSSADVHDSCLTCHTFDADKRGILRDFTNQKGVNGPGSLPDGGDIGGTNGGGNCSACHTVSPVETYHHTSPRTAVGQCEICHVDPRPAWGLTYNDGENFNPGDNGSGSGLARPTQMACRECHVSFDGAQMTVTKYWRKPVDDIPFKDAWQSELIHTVPVTATGINNYGICLSCHYVGNSVSAPPVALWHAHPSVAGGGDWTFYPGNADGNVHTGKTWLRGSDSWDVDETYPQFTGDKAHYAPGRTNSRATDVAPASGIGGFNIFAQHYGLDSIPPDMTNVDWNVYASWNSNEDFYSYRGQGYNTPPFQRIAIPDVPTIGDASPDVSGFTRAVPVFGGAGPANGTAMPAADDIIVSAAVFSATKLTVVASTDSPTGCSTLTAEYGAASEGMAGNSPNCSAVFSSPSYPANGTTVNVRTSNSSGINIFGYPITDNSAAAEISADKSVFTWYNSTEVTFTNDTGFSADGIDHVGYAWDQNSTHNFTGSEFTWSSGDKLLSASSTGNWYLHVRSYNNSDQPLGNDVTYGPYNYENGKPAISSLTPVDGMAAIPLNSNLTFSLTDSLSGIDWTSFAIQLDDGNGYLENYTDEDTSVVSKAGSPASYDVTVNPDTDFSSGGTITVTVNVNDAAGNSLTLPVWSFTAENNNFAPTLNWTNETGYLSDGVNPDSDMRSSNFTFRVAYDDDDNDRPVTVQVWVDRNDDNSYGPGEKFVMDEVDADDPLYSDDKLYTATIPLEYLGDGTLKYRFYAADFSHAATGPPVSDKSVTVTRFDGLCINETFTAPSGQVDDNSPGSFYAKNESCWKLIQPAGAAAIRVDFTEFELSPLDYVKVYDGPNASSPLLGAFYGLKMPSQLVSTGGSVFVQFWSNNGGQGDGFTLQYFAEGLADSDSDGWYDSDDNCPADANPGQADSEGDGVGDVCDNCPFSINPDQADDGGDGIGDACYQCPNDLNFDQDNDDICVGEGFNAPKEGDNDNCPEAYNPLSDCDSNPVTPKEQCDADGDGLGDACDPDGDVDGDGFINSADNCPLVANPGQEDGDGDLIGDVCDVCPSETENDRDGDGICAGTGFKDPMTDENDTCPADPDPSCTEPVKRIIFASINTYNGDFDQLGDNDGNGLEEADDVCNIEKPPNVTKVKAFMSGDASTEILDLPTRYMSDYGFDLDATGKKIYVFNRATTGFSVLKNSWALLISPNTPSGDVVTTIAAGTGLGPFVVYSGSLGNAAYYPNKTCGNWSDSTAVARSGSSIEVQYNWWFAANGDIACSLPQRILCIGVHE